jgi:hypothetical protein
MKEQKEQLDKIVDKLLAYNPEKKNNSNAKQNEEKPSSVQKVESDE